MRPDIAAVDADALNEFDRLSNEISDRQSIRFLSRAMMSGFVALIGLGLSLKLFNDSKGFPIAGYLAAVVDVGAWSVAVISAWKTRHFLRMEASIFERLRKAQERLGISRELP